MKERYGKRLPVLTCLGCYPMTLEQDPQQETDDPVSEDASGTTMSTESLQKFSTDVTSIIGLAQQNETKFSAPSTLLTTTLHVRKRFE